MTISIIMLINVHVAVHYSLANHTYVYRISRKWVWSHRCMVTLARISCAGSECRIGQSDCRDQTISRNTYIWHAGNNQLATYVVATRQWASVESSGSNHEAAEKLGYLELHQKVEVQSFMNSMELFGMSSLASH